MLARASKVTGTRRCSCGCPAIPASSLSTSIAPAAAKSGWTVLSGGMAWALARIPSKPDQGGVLGNSDAAFGEFAQGPERDLVADREDRVEGLLGCQQGAGGAAALFLAGQVGLDLDEARRQARFGQALGIAVVALLELALRARLRQPMQAIWR